MIPSENFATVVSGLPRSGTSMMMRMLEAGGLSPLTDHLRAPDQDNPSGYYEYEKAKELETDPSAIDEARGKAVKVVSELLPHIPFHRLSCKIVFMKREFNEMLNSQKKMLARAGKLNDRPPDSRILELLKAHTRKITGWLDESAPAPVLYVSYNEIISSPNRELSRLTDFLGLPLDIPAMVHVVDPSLYRNRS